MFQWKIHNNKKVVWNVKRARGINNENYFTLI